MNGGRPFNLGRFLSTVLVASIWILSVPAATLACTCCACDEGGEIRCDPDDTDCGDCIVFGGVPAAMCGACDLEPGCGGQTFCAGDPQMCLTGATGACCGAQGNCGIVTAAGCAAAGGTYRGDGTDCSEPCKEPLGEPCSTGDDCTSTFCADGVCCDTACTDPGFICDSPKNEGMCVPGGTAPEPAPALASWALYLTAALLVIIGIVAVRRQGRRSS
jgi:hypothetical protein